MRQVLSIFIVILGLIALTAAAGASAKRAKKATEQESELAHAPVAAHSWRNPYEGRPEAVLAGKQIYDRHCAQCHGADGRGQGKAPDLHSASIQKAAPGTLFWFLKNGNLKEGMPSWSRLPDPQLWQLVTFLQTLR